MRRQIRALKVRCPNLISCTWPCQTLFLPQGVFWVGAHSELENQRGIIEIAVQVGQLVDFRHSELKSPI